MGIFSFLKRQKAKRDAGPDETDAATDAAAPAPTTAPTTAPTPAEPADAPADGPGGSVTPASAVPQAPPPVAPPLADDTALERAAASRPLQAKLGRTRSRFRDNLLDFLLGDKPIDDELLEELESQLIMADVGVDATQRIMATLNERVARADVGNAEALRGALREALIDLLNPVEAPLEIPERKSPFVILVVGVNGSGKTTTIGKLARQMTDGGLSVMLAAGDTFRAAAVEQLQTWGDRNGVPVVSQGSGADSASVVFDALQSATSRGIDVLIADTAGRLHTQANLIEELAKVKRVLAKIDPDAPHETLIVLDGGTGQNALAQARQFHEAIGLTGMAVTKLDGTARGGVVFAIAQALALPIRFIGVGERVFDLEVFEAGRFVDALMDTGSKGVR